MALAAAAVLAVEPHPAQALIDRAAVAVRTDSQASSRDAPAGGSTGIEYA